LYAVCAALAGCLSNTGDSVPPPTGIKAVVGDGYAGLSWNSELGVSYLVFGSINPNLTTLNWLDPGINGFALNNLGTDAQPPDLLCNATNGQDYYFTISAHTGTAPGGPGSPVVRATARAAGGAGTWILGTPIGTNINGAGYAGISGCSANAAPTGIYVAVGPTGQIFSSSTGSTWTSRTPVGYTTDLYGVAAYTSPVSTVAAPSLALVAVGAGSAVLTSTDAITWTSRVAANGAMPTLRAAAVAGNIFIAVGDSGHIQSSLDGITWTTQTSNTAVNLHAVDCAFVSTGYTCVAVGDAGVIDVSADSGTTWTAQTVGGGASALRAVVYGNFDNNLGANGVVGIGGAAPTSINTWVAVGDAGAVFVDSTGTWFAAPLAGAPNLVSIAYSTQFVALDASGNAYTSQTAISGSWSAAAVTGVANPAAITGNGHGFVAIGTAGDNASSF